MGNLIRMDLYRMKKATIFRVCLILAFVLALASTPLAWALTLLSRTITPEEPVDFPAQVNLAEFIASPMSSIIGMLAMLSIVGFFYADMENGYIKNIAGQMPRKGFSILSRFIAAVVHNAVFMLVALAGNLAGTVFLQKIVVESSIADAVVQFLLKLLLLQSVSAILLLVTSSFRIKSLGMILAVLMGLPLMRLIYLAINSGLSQIFKGADIIPYMPDSVLQESSPDVLRALLVAVITIAVFLPLSIRVFDKKDVK